MKKALFTGSFDPITNGHLEIIRRASKLTDELTVGVVFNPQKQGLFTLGERVKLIEENIKDLGNVKVSSFSGLLGDFIREEGFDAVIRSLRGVGDFEYEYNMSHMNDTLFPEGVESVFLMGKAEYAFISSSWVKEVASLHGTVETLVPENVRLALEDKYRD